MGKERAPHLSFGTEVSNTNLLLKLSENYLSFPFSLFLFLLFGMWGVLDNVIWLYPSCTSEGFISCLNDTFHDSIGPLE